MPKVDMAKRRKIMQRSMKLGHCVCDPQRTCPCEVFTTRGICPCAGERPDPIPADQVKLTELVHNTGCASKIAPADLERVLARLPAVEDPAVLCGVPAGDDAGIYKLADGTDLVQTVDVMTPCVDDPYTFGRICAANCLSDIYAMGGVPRTALSILGFPAESLDGDIMYQMMKGAMDIFAEASVALIGGHSIKDEEIKLGFAITGTIEPGHAVEHSTAKDGDLLVLTKPLGTGVLSFSRQIGRIGDEQLAEARESMATLNKAAAEVMSQVGVSACTDVTGFGLFGHLIAMARASLVTAEVWADALPALTGALDALQEGVIPGAVERNREYVADDIITAEGVDESRVNLGFDAQTSGGLLMAVPQDRHEKLMAALIERGVDAVTIGKIVAESAGQIVVTLSGKEIPMSDRDPCCQSAAGGEDRPDAEHSEARCADVVESTSPVGQSNVPQANRAYGALIRAVTSAGQLDAKTKELVNFALVVMARCEPCIKAHFAKATKMGITRDELEEAAWLAVAMGGAPVRLFYLQVMEQTEGGQAKSCC